MKPARRLHAPDRRKERADFQLLEPENPGSFHPGFQRMHPGHAAARRSSRQRVWDTTTVACTKAPRDPGPDRSRRRKLVFPAVASAGARFGCGANARSPLDAQARQPLIVFGQNEMFEPCRHPHPSKATSGLRSRPAPATRSREWRDGSGVIRRGQRSQDRRRGREPCGRCKSLMPPIVTIGVRQETKASRGTDLDQGQRPLDPGKGRQKHGTAPGLIGLGRACTHDPGDRLFMIGDRCIEFSGRGRCPGDEPHGSEEEVGLLPVLGKASEKNAARRAIAPHAAPGFRRWLKRPRVA